MNLTKAIIIFVAVLSATPSIGQEDSKWNVDGAEVPNTEWRNADGPFKAMLFFSDDPESLYRTWSSSATPKVSGVDSIQPGQNFEAIVIFVDCQPDDSGQCHVTSDWEIATSDGRVLGNPENVPTWVNQRVGRPGELMMAEQGVGLAAELDFEGSYLFTVLVRDDHSGRQVQLKRQIIVGSAEKE